MTADKKIKIRGALQREEDGFGRDMYPTGYNALILTVYKDGAASLTKDDNGLSESFIYLYPSQLKNLHKAFTKLLKRKE